MLDVGRVLRLESQDVFAIAMISFLPCGSYRASRLFVEWSCALFKYLIWTEPRVAT